MVQRSTSRGFSIARNAEDATTESAQSTTSTPRRVATIPFKNHNSGWIPQSPNLIRKANVFGTRITAFAISNPLRINTSRSVLWPSTGAFPAYITRSSTDTTYPATSTTRAGAVFHGFRLER